MGFALQSAHPASHAPTAHVACESQVAVAWGKLHDAQVVEPQPVAGSLFDSQPVEHCF